MDLEGTKEGSSCPRSTCCKKVPNQPEQMKPTLGIGALTGKTLLLLLDGSAAVRTGTGQGGAKRQARC
jgi:hypothetical protein